MANAVRLSCCLQSVISTVICSSNQGMLKEKIRQQQNGILLYGLTPPKQKTSQEKIQEIAQKQIERLQNLGIDGLILYDIQEETERTKEERPFPFLPTLDPSDYHQNYLNPLALPKIIYRYIGKYSETHFSNWLLKTKATEDYAVFVGAASKKQTTQLTMSQAYHLRRKINPALILGGVAIPERHLVKNDEHVRVYNKIEQGCEFFVSQAVYNIEATKNFLSDYYYFSQKHQKTMVPIIFTITPCGSLKTLQFMKWLGIHVPQWLENELQYSADILNKSVQLSKRIFQELWEFGIEKNIPIGCNIESISIRKIEIEASIQLLQEIKEIFATSLIEQPKARTQATKLP